MWERCVRGGYERKLRDTRDGRERRDVKSVDFYLVSQLSLVPLFFPASPAMNQVPATGREMLECRTHFLGLAMFVPCA